jgi:hypothetical protein
LEPLDKTKNKIMEKLIDIVRDNTANFLHAVGGVLYYRIETQKMVYIFPIDMNDKEDVGTATFEATHKAITLMRYLNKSIKNNSLICYERKNLNYIKE